jgi:3-oxoacyl-[acyl-carrier protein] reductase
MLAGHGSDRGIDTSIVDLDPAVVALLPLSTLIGMKLPGRPATFTEFNVEFGAVSSQPAELSGTVASISKASGKINLDLVWTQQGSRIGTGTAVSLINPAAPKPIDCAEIRAGHLGLGLHRKTALITGASRGIGAATARLLAMNGTRVLVHYFQGKADAASIVEDILANGGQAAAVQADFRDEASIDAMFDAIEAEATGVDILVNNAVGEFSVKPFDAVRSEDFLKEFNITILAAHTCCRRVLPHMKKQGWGRIINTGTIATEMPSGGQSHYATVKSALTGFTRSLASELARDNITVNMVVPRMTETTLVSSIPQGLVRKLAEDGPRGELLQPIEIAKAVLFFASNLAADISGQRLALNQGEPPFI